MSTSSETYPLDGVTVIDFSRLLPGPWCTQMLGDLGAVVIKVEEPKLGDASRYNPPLYQQSSVYYNSVNGNKKSITLDLRTKAGQCIAHRLMESADVVVESFRPGVSKKLGVDYSTAKALNRGIIYCSFSGFGQSGPWVNVSGHDLAVQSMSGLMTLTAEGNEVPHMPGFQAADYAAATMASIGVLSAVIRHMKTGNGAYLDIAMFDSLFSMSNVILSGAKARTAGGEGYPMMQLWGVTHVTVPMQQQIIKLFQLRYWKPHYGSGFAKLPVVRNLLTPMKCRMRVTVRTGIELAIIKKRLLIIVQPEASRKYLKSSKNMVYRSCLFYLPMKPFILRTLRRGS